MDDLQTAHGRLKFARQQKGYKSTRAFAIKNNIVPSTYTAHESGGRKYDYDTAKKYAKLLDTDAPWLMDGSNHHPAHQSSNGDETPIMPVNIDFLKKCREKADKVLADVGEEWPNGKWMSYVIEIYNHAAKEAVETGESPKVSKTLAKLFFDKEAS